MDLVKYKGVLYEKIFLYNFVFDDYFWSIWATKSNVNKLSPQQLDLWLW